MEISSRTMGGLLCDTGRDRLLNPGNISSNLRHSVAGLKHSGKVFGHMITLESVRAREYVGE